ncbi:hypothetical protein C8R43DRAFT_278621 [Mycena crocata]|nr:hypothetical protein C8R43DRAFT_278621 [Mycena crocata]
MSMSREDRRPLSQVPEDSVNTYMHPFPSYPPPAQDSFTLLSPYNPTDQNIFDTFAYYPSDANPSLNYPPPSDWAYYYPADVQDLSVGGTEYCHLSSMHFPELPLHAPVPLPEQASLPLLSDPSPDNEAIARDQCYDQYISPAFDFDAILNLTEHLPDPFPNTEYCREFFVPELASIPVPDMKEFSGSSGSSPSSTGSSPSQRQSRPRPRQSPPRRSRPSRVPSPRASGFIPSDPDELSAHQKNRLYVECLEHYVQYLHQLFASIYVQPLPLERRVANRGLTSRSMRTILLHLGKSADLIHLRTLQEEKKSRDLNNALLEAQAMRYATQLHSTAVSPSSDGTCVASDLETTKFFPYSPV